jgi:arsenate reductase-like glutaredoxin family protein
MTTARNFKPMLDEAEVDYIRLQKDPANPALLSELYNKVENNLSELEEGYTKEMKTTDQFRSEAHSALIMLRDAINKISPPMFDTNDSLNIQAGKRVDRLKGLIKHMTDNAKSEKFIRELILALYSASNAHKLDLVKQESDNKSKMWLDSSYSVDPSLFGRRYIATEHKAIQEAWNLYYTKAFENYSKILVTPGTESRREGIKKKIESFIANGKLQGPALQAAMNIIEQNK